MLTITISRDAEVMLREFRRMKKTLENREKKSNRGEDVKKVKYVRKDIMKLITVQESWSDVIVWMGKTLKDHSHTRPKDGT